MFRPLLPLLRTSSISIYGKRTRTLLVSKQLQLLVPVLKTPWNVDNFESRRHEFGCYLYVYTRMGEKVNDISERTKAGESLSLSERFVGGPYETGKMLVADETKAVVDKEKGFYLNSEPFYVPSHNSLNLLTALKNNWNLLKLKGQDPSFDLSQLKNILASIFERVTQSINKQQFDQLEGLISPDVINQIKSKTEQLDEKQKELLNLTEAELYKVDPNRETPGGSTEFYSGECTDIVRVNFRQEKDATFVDLLVLYVGVYKFKDLSENWPKLSAEYGYELAKVIFGNFMFTKRVKPKLDNDWLISKLNYIVVP